MPLAILRCYQEGGMEGDYTLYQTGLLRCLIATVLYGLQVNELGRENIRLRQQVSDLAETNRVLIESVPKLADKCKCVSPVPVQ